MSREPIQFYIYRGEEISLVKGTPEAEALIDEFGYLNLDSEPARLTDGEIEKYFPTSDPQGLADRLYYHYQKVKAGLSRTYFLSPDDFYRRPTDKMRWLMKQTPGVGLGISSMFGQTDLSYGPPPEMANDMLRLYAGLYEPPQKEIGSDISGIFANAGEMCSSETYNENKPMWKSFSNGKNPDTWWSDLARICVSSDGKTCNELQFVGLKMDPQYCFEASQIEQALRILHQYDEQIRKVSQLISIQHPEVKASNVRLFLYSSLFLEMAKLQPHDVWQDISACYWTGGCGFYDKIDPVVFERAYEVYDGRLKQLEEDYEMGKENCSLFHGFSFSLDECASEKGIREYIMNTIPGWKQRLAWKMASEKPETHRTKQGFGLGQIILGYAMQAASEEKVFRSFVEAGLLTREQFSSEKSALNTILSPESMIYAKGLTFSYALAHVKKTRLNHPEIAFPSDNYFMIPNDATAREMALLAMAELNVRFPDEDLPWKSSEEMDEAYIQIIEENAQDVVGRMFMVGHFLGEVPDTPGLRIVPFQEGISVPDQWDGYIDIFDGEHFKKGHPLVKELKDEKQKGRLYFHWIPSFPHLKPDL